MLTHKYYPVLGFVFVCLVLCFPAVVKADAAPPLAPPGSSVATYDFETHVQMVSEEVIIDVQTYHGPSVNLIEDEEVSEEHMAHTELWSVLGEGDLVGHVTASFTMQNQGDEPESFEVWFPIGTNRNSSIIVTVANFQAWVNGSLVETGRRRIEDEYGESMPWATWPVDFPVGEQVQLMVTYDLPPSPAFKRDRFDYILETGAGWWDVIETGHFTFRLPFEVTEENTSLLTGNNDNITISGNEIYWEFSDLEPDQYDNIYLTIIEPSAWEEILLARAEVDANPNAVESYLRLARALIGAMGFKYEMHTGQEFIPETIQAYEEALELAPDEDNIEIYIEYIEFLYRITGSAGPLPDQLEPTLMRALEIDPDNERLLAWERELPVFKQELADYATMVALLTNTPTTPPEETPSPTATLTQTQPAPTSTITLTPTLTATADAPPQSTQQSRGFPLWVILGSSGIFLLALAAVLRRQARDGESTSG